MPIHRSTARNFATNTENRIHSDEVAAGLGFEGALVPGAAVFGHMTRPLVETLGTHWLAGHRAELRLLKPAYHGDELTICHEAAGGEQVVRCRARGVLLAELRTRPTLPEVDPRASLAGGAPIDARPEIHWDNVQVDRPVPSLDLGAGRRRQRRGCRASGRRPGLLPRTASCIPMPS